MKKLFNNVVSVLVLLIIALLIVPLPAPVLDFMFIFNLMLSLVILLITMYIREPLEFAVFPSVLLLTTLFRLALNVRSTFRILMYEGDAGQVVKTFGEFVLGGNMVVGMVIFIIIVLVQFIVITKGSERVAEVSARFTLDAMPGKQMAIDADLSSGLIDEQEARRRRSKIQREADFFGAMDGASKFVKGDAIISIIITLINIIGGIIVGSMNGVENVMQTYSIATVGDGLMSQVPALLISVATGMVVTRSASESNLAEEVKNQFLSQPRVLMIAAGAMLCTMFIGFPIPQVIVISGFMFAAGYLLQKKGSPGALAQEAEAEVPGEEITSEADYYKNIDNVYNLLNVEQIEMEFGYSLIPLVDEKSGGSFIDRVVMFRKQFAQEMGVVVPSVRLKDSGQLNPNQYDIKFKGETVAVGDVLVDHYLALPPEGGPDTIEGIETVEPAFGLPAKWISEDKRIQAELAGYTLIDPTSVIITHLSEVIRTHAYELLSRQEVGNMLTNMKKVNENLVNDIVPNPVSVSDLQKVLAALLREGVPVRDLETILETLADYCPVVKDIDMLTEHVRQALRRTISHKFSEAGQMKVISLDAEIENTIMGAVKKVDNGSYLALEPDVIQNIVTRTKEEIDKIHDLVTTPIILTSPIVRIYFKKLMDQFFPGTVVLSFNEIENDIQVQALGNITL